MKELPARRWCRGKPFSLQPTPARGKELLVYCCTRPAFLYVGIRFIHTIDLPKRTSTLPQREKTTPFSNRAPYGQVVLAKKVRVQCIITAHFTG